MYERINNQPYKTRKHEDHYLYFIGCGHHHDVSRLHKTGTHILKRRLSSIEPEIVKKGTTVNIMYGIPDADGKIEFAHRTAETDINGFFEYQIGCPTGKTMTVKVNSSEMGYSYTKDKEGSFVESEAFFFAELDKTVPGGKTVYFALDLTPSAYTSEDGMTQPADGTGKP